MTATATPAHVPADRIVDIDIYMPPGIEAHGFHKAWSDLTANNPAVNVTGFIAFTG